MGFGMCSEHLQHQSPAPWIPSIPTTQPTLCYFCAVKEHYSLFEYINAIFYEILKEEVVKEESCSEEKRTANFVVTLHSEMCFVYCYFTWMFDLQRAEWCMCRETRRLFSPSSAEGGKVALCSSVFKTCANKNDFMKPLAVWYEDYRSVVVKLECNIR